MSLMSWGMYPRIKNSVFLFDKDALLKQIVFRHHDLIPCGNGDSALSANIINVKPHDYFIDFDEESGFLHVQAGVLLSEILESFVPRGWFLKVTPGTKLITVGGAIASDVHVKKHHVEGCFSESVKELQIMLADGKIATCSKRSHPEFFKATCGGQGLTDIILTAKITLKKIKLTTDIKVNESYYDDQMAI